MSTMHGEKAVVIKSIHEHQRVVFTHNTAPQHGTLNNNTRMIVTITFPRATPSLHATVRFPPRGPPCEGP
ncbi:hypothetical protein NHX12_003755 [Muraenolepis orangiensis]|uniref:Uncharacterized protein n=1 Tax=Muraenolepis orangiensis TaxID=630683 RepID=A0A9Q0IE34_9TELE|nr:hypothetical protein NHX12_003755 [Muraenolepis orangiensis]